MDFAILQNGKVANLIGIFPTNWQQFEEVVVAHRNVKVGDDYIMGYFYRNGEKVLTPEEENYQGLVNEMRDALALLGVTMDLPGDAASTNYEG